MKMSEYFLKKPTLFWSLMVAIIIGGIYSFNNMPKLEDPEISIKQAKVILVYPGATAHDVELEVTSVMEEALRAMPNIRNISSESSDGMAIITTELELTVEEKDVQQYWDLLRRKVNDAASSLPSGCRQPMVVDDVSDVYGMFFALSGKGYSNVELNKYAEYIRRNLLSVKGVKRVTISGNRQECIDVTLPKEYLSRNGVTATQIMSAIDAGNKDISAGKYDENDRMLQLRVSDKIKSEDDISNLVIKTTSGERVRLGDFAKIERGYTDPQTGGFWVDGNEAVAILLSAEPGVNVTEVGKKVTIRLEELMNTLPVGLQTEKIFFQPDKVNSAINSFLLNLVESVLIVIIALIFTMGFRSGLIIGSGLVLTIAASFPVLLSLGSTLQRISLGAFIIAMGMLVDNSIVIIDGIMVDRQRGLSPKKYLFGICKRTAMPLLGATIIAATTFLSVYLAKGSASEYAHDLFLVLSVSLLISWFLAMTQVPMFVKTFIPIHPKHPAANSGDVLNKPIHKIVRRLVTTLIAYKKLTLVAAVCLLVLSCWSFKFVKNLFFPDFDYSQFIVEMRMPPQTNPDVLKENMINISKDIKKDFPLVDRVTASQSGAPARYCLVRPMTNGGANYGELLIDCKDFKTCSKVIPELKAYLRERYPNTYIRTRRYNFSISTTHTVEAQFSGPDPAVLRHLSAQAEEIMRGAESVDHYSVENDWQPMNKVLVAQYLQSEGRKSGISRSDIGNALQAATTGLTVGVLHDKDKTVLINMKIRNADGSKIKDLNDIPVWTTMPNMNVGSKQIQSLIAGSKDKSSLEDEIYKSAPLSTVSSNMNLEWEEGMVKRYDCMRAIEAECDPDFDNGSTPTKVMQEIQAKIEAIPLPTGYHLKWMGEMKSQGESTDSLYAYLPLTLIIILAVLLILFNSWKKLALILVCIPFVMVGITPALIGTGIPFTFMGLVGIMGLMGMMIKNSIVLVDEINRLITEEGITPYNAVIQATVSRANPVIMASATTIVGMVPLLPDPMYGSMAVAIMSGLTVGTIITLMLLPVFYSLVFKINKPKTVD